MDSHYIWCWGWREPSGLFQLHVMDSWGHYSTSSVVLLYLSTPCNGFVKVWNATASYTVVASFQLHVMDSGPQLLEGRGCKGLSTPCNGFYKVEYYLPILDWTELSTPCNGFQARGQAPQQARHNIVCLSTPCNGFRGADRPRWGCDDRQGLSTPCNGFGVGLWATRCPYRCRIGSFNSM